MSKFIHFFVYGTLKPGEINYRICADFVVEAQPAIAQGQLYHLPFGYPAMTVDEVGTVHGYILSFRDPVILTILDEFEQHSPELFQQLLPGESYADNQYTRQQFPVITPKRSPVIAWGYVMSPNQISRLRGTPVPGGQWSGNLVSNEYYR